MRRGASTTVLLVVLVGTVWGLMHVGWYSHGQITDYGVYAHYGDAIVHTHAVPYRDFPMEYPPAALPVFVAPALLERFDYDRVFQLLMALCDVGAVLARTRGPRAAGRWAAEATATAAAWFLPFVALSPAGVGHTFHTQLARPLQLESLAGSVLIAAHKIAGTTLYLTAGYGSQNLGGTGTHAAVVVTSIAGALALVAIWIAFARGPATEERFFACAAAAVAAFVAFGKVFSPQFLIWLIPLVVLVRGRRAHLAFPLFALALVLTQLRFPRHHWDLALRFASPYSWLLLVRDLAVVALVAAFVWPRSQHELLGEHRSRLEALQRVRAEIQ